MAAEIVTSHTSKVDISGSEVEMNYRVLYGRAHVRPHSVSSLGAGNHTMTLCLSAIVNPRQYGKSEVITSNTECTVVTAHLDTVSSFYQG